MILMTRWREDEEVVGVRVAMRLKRIVVKEVAPVDSSCLQCLLDHTHFPAHCPVEKCRQGTKATIIIMTEIILLHCKYFLLRITLEHCPEREVSFVEECSLLGTTPPAGQGESPPLTLVQSG